jgi:hypothetical protein
MSGGMPAGSGRALRLDPAALPVTFSASDAQADGRTRQVELTRERVVVRRAVAGMRMAVNLPVSAYRGVAIRSVTLDDAGAAVAIVLVHLDPALDLMLAVTDRIADIVMEWQEWANTLGVPLLPAEQDNAPAAKPAGSVQAHEACPRRRRRNAIKQRRPSILMRRAPKRLSGETTIHGGEREIIARD